MVKDANKPKGRTSAYAFFVLSCRDKLKKTSTPMNYCRLSMTCLEQWKTLSAAEKKTFEDMAVADKARYDEEMKIYSMVKDAKGRTSAYAFFVLSCRDKLKKTSPDTPVNFSEFSKSCSEQWNALSATEKKTFEDLAMAEKARYKEEMKNCVPPEGRGKKGRKKKDPNAPKWSPSAFFIFCSEQRPTIKSEYPNLSIGEIAKKLVEMWSKLSKKERAPFEQKAVLLREKYEDVAAYRAGEEAAKRGPGQPTGSTENVQAEPGGQDEVDEEDEEDEEDYDEDEEEEAGGDEN